MQWEDSADTFALGITLYELLTHSYPWPGKRIPVLDKKPADIMSLNSLISPDFGAFVMKAINTRHENRFKAAKEMLEAVEAIGESGIAKKTEVSVLNYNGQELQIVDISIAFIVRVKEAMLGHGQDGKVIIY